MSRWLANKFSRIFGRSDDNSQASTNGASAVHADATHAPSGNGFVATNEVAIRDEEMDQAVVIESNGGGSNGFAEATSQPMAVDVIVKNEPSESNEDPFENEAVSVQRDTVEIHEEKVEVATAPTVQIHERKDDAAASPVENSPPVVVESNGVASEDATSVPMAIDVEVKTETVEVAAPSPPPVISPPVAAVSNDGGSRDATSVAMSIDVEVKTETAGVQSPLKNVSVNTQRDQMTKFFDENPTVAAKEGKGEDVIGPVVPVAPPEQVVYSAKPMIAPTVYPDPVKNLNVSVKAELTAPTPVAVTKPDVHLQSSPPNKPPTNRPSVPPTQRQALNDRQVKNRADGFSFKVCDLNRLKRFIVLGSEHNTYYSTPGQNPHLSNQLQNTIDNIQCIQNLLRQGRHDEVLETITTFSVEGRVAKEEPILAILAMCAEHSKLEVRKAAYTRVVEICNIPTKLFRFLELTQDKIYATRKTNPPQPQKIGVKRKRTNIESNLQALEIVEPVEKKPSTNSEEPAKKKKKKRKKVYEFKKINKKPKKSSGWGRLRRKAVSRFYADDNKNGARLVYLLTKYKHRHGWTHKEVLQFAHPKMDGESETVDLQAKNLALKYCTHGYKKMKDEFVRLSHKAGVSKPVSEVIGYIDKLEEVNSLSPSNPADLDKLLDILKTYGARRAREVDESKAENEEEIADRKEPIQIVREHIPTGFLNNNQVWEALLLDMPMTALIRNLGKMSSMKLFDKRENEELAVNSLLNVKKLKYARIHPMKILLAMKTYEQGHGDKGDLDWRPNRKIVEALDKAFYLSFKQPEVKDNYRTNKKYMLCLDVSGSMTFHGCKGCEIITPAIASVAMAWVTWNIEEDENIELVAFGGQLVDMKGLGYHKDMLITDVLRKTRGIRFGSTDCSLPMLHALKNRLEVDVFIVYTDSDTWAGRVHPVTALKDYNKEMGRVAKLIVLGMDSNGFTIADPQDPNMMDIVGFDANVPELIAQFANGNLSEVCGDKCEDCSKKLEAFGRM